MDLFKRARLLNNYEYKAGAIIYWMSRDQRVQDNHSLLFARHLALEKEAALIVMFNLVDSFLNAGLRQFGFMLKGLNEVAKELENYNIPFYFLQGEPSVTVPAFIKETGAGLLVTDFDPLKIKKKWKGEVSAKITIPFYEVDSHNIIPCWLTSPKLEYGAYTIRPKINKLLPEFLREYPELKIMKESNLPCNYKIRTIELDKHFDASVPQVNWITPGSRAAMHSLENFLENKLDKYAEFKNDPCKDYQSGLSPYLHFGQISSQRITLNSEKHPYKIESKTAFLEELIVRKELSDNFCFYNENYESYEGFPLWAKSSLYQHKNDRREFIYSLKEFEIGKTHEDLWNAAQFELVKTGKMHGYMRMYWAKKILEWSKSPQDALKTTIYLNDKYELDGRDPNGYAGCAWSIGGTHDRAWFERPVFGKIRYMNRNGAKKKFDIESYIAKFT